jgi:hypothetical protein
LVSQNGNLINNPSDFKLRLNGSTGLSDFNLRLNGSTGLSDFKLRLNGSTGLSDAPHPVNTIATHLLSPSARIL